MELWKAIPSYEGFYEASTLGRVRSVQRYIDHPRNKSMKLIRPSKILKSELDKSGYPVVTLSKDAKTRTYKVHRLIAKTFIPNPDNLDQIDHINAVRYDNRPENLRWCTTQQNTKWRDDKYRPGDRAVYKLICKETGHTFKSSYEAAHWVISRGLPRKSSNFKTVAKSIRAACTGRVRSSYTFHWAYIEGSTTTSEKVELNTRNGEPCTRQVKI